MKPDRQNTLLPGRIELRRIGPEVSIDLTELAGGVAAVFGFKAGVGDALDLDERWLDPRRGQYRTTAFLNMLAELRSGQLILGVAGVDIFVPRLNFVFGEADAGRGVAVISTHRLLPHFYGHAENKQLLRERALKEAVHETGHLVGLQHCGNRLCVMNFSNSVADTDEKGPGFGAECLARLKARGIAAG